MKNLNFRIHLDIDECVQNETVPIYTEFEGKENIYKWTKCSANGSICSNKLGSFECKCLPGYQGDGYVCHDIDECDLANTVSSLLAQCPLNSICVNYPGSYDCKCFNGLKKHSNECIGLILTKS